MQAINTTKNAATVVAGVFSFDVRNTSTPKVAKPVYEIEEVYPDGENLDVDYLLNGQYSRTAIEYNTLKGFVLANGLNDFTNDSSDHAGEHVQECGSVPVDEYIDENMSYCVKVYLQSIKAGQVNVN